LSAAGAGVIAVDVVAPMPAGSDGSSRRGGDQRPVNRGWREDPENDLLDGSTPAPGAEWTWLESRGGNGEGGEF